MDPMNGNKPLLKILAGIAVLLTFVALVLSGVFRDTGVSAEAQRANNFRLDRIEQDYVKRTDLDKMERRMERIEDKVDRVLRGQISAEHERNRR